MSSEGDFVGNKNKKCKQPDDFWKKLERFKSEKFPPCVVAILKENGYTSSSIVAAITSDDLIQIEQYTNKYYRDLINSLDCCNAQTYKKQTEFRFLPGHRGFILNLPIEVQKMKEVSSTKRPYKSREQSKNSTLPSKLPSKKTAHNSEMTEKNESSNGNGAGVSAGDFATEISENEHDPLAEELQAELIHKLKQAGDEKKHSWAKMIQASVISEIEMSFDLERNMSGAKCHVICPFCATKCSIKYDRFWRTSNFLKHLYLHESEKTRNENENAKENVPLRNEIQLIEFDGFGDSNEDDEQNTQLSRTVELRIKALKSPTDDKLTETTTHKRTTRSKNVPK